MGEVIAFRPRAGSGAAATTGSRGDSLPGPTRRELPSSVHAPAPSREPLWREITGQVLRDERHRQHRTLAQVAERAGMSVQYLSELERGRKEASSEMLAAACGALGLSLAQFAQRSAGALAPTGPVLLAA